MSTIVLWPTPFAFQKKCLFKFIIAKLIFLIFVIFYWIIYLTLWNLCDSGPQLLIHTTLGYLMHIICQMIIYIILLQNHMEVFRLPHVVLLNYIRVCVCVCVRGWVAFIPIVFQDLSNHIIIIISNTDLVISQ